MTWHRKYKNISNGTSLNIAQNIIINNENTHIPLNLPTFIVGSKNAGKSTLISTLINCCVSNGVYTRIIYIYSDHVDTTLAEQCDKALIRVPFMVSALFLQQYLNIKTEYMSWIKFVDKNNNQTGATLNDMLKNYTDNIIDAYVRKNININNDKQTPNNQNIISSPENQIIEHARNYILKYSQQFDINVNGVIYHIEGLRYDQYDQLIIDDVGTVADTLFPTAAKSSPIYKYLTISRHILLGTIISGQDLMQLPRYARKEIAAYIIGVGIDINDTLKTNIPNRFCKHIINEYNEIKQYDFIGYSSIDNNIFWLKNDE